MTCYMRILIPLLVAYLVLSANLEPDNVILGTAIAAGVMALLPRLSGERKCTGFLTAVPAIVQYVGILGFDLLKSGIQVAGIVLSPEMPIQPGIVAVPSDCRSDLGRALSAHAVTLTPGQLVVGIGRDGVMYTHCLNVSAAAEGLFRAQKTREALLHRIFLSPP
ncbi:MULTISPECIES: Na+/H+ antiporter subunit E [Desulfococcus]|uniref:Cation antiporter n=1 Tax=Desulfococcus multivorans DSM 2059 TaxID=1121405 RepID=S7TF56_DESML|nr:Na+/H+ antiporter subunit E [Desulfococcus multivorans]AOY59826.1 MrpE: predicted Na(+)/H(+) antiporter, subunit E (Multiple resistance and pH homeostasis protein E) [Desulfococcus multivorans]EPR35827.1 cation antiporter [Desulfococcus multivorans DSM 2059]MDX9819309.1 Na+/H+ antiporter subunit E [Desulfococcus multivorans]SJZ33798.1 multicomponent Na+:H+ antiporter subunit E [Desulfococcus multivorans DSM 2059]